MKEQSIFYITHLIERYPQLKQLNKKLIKSVEILIESISQGAKILICGNGGSAADSEHIVGELMKGFVLPRKIKFQTQVAIRNEYPNIAEYLISNLQIGIPAISLVSHTALTSAFSNDKAPDLIFAQQVLGYGNKGDILIAISTSGNSSNVLYAAQIARVIGLKVISLTGNKGGKLKEISTVLLNVPDEETYKIQELHLPIYHAICLALENELFGE